MVEINDHSLIEKCFKITLKSRMHMRNPPSPPLHSHLIIGIIQFTYIYLNLIQKALDCCVELQMGEETERNDSEKMAFTSVA